MSVSTCLASARTGGVCATAFSITMILSLAVLALRAAAVTAAAVFLAWAIALMLRSCALDMCNPILVALGAVYVVRAFGFMDEHEVPRLTARVAARSSVWILMCRDLRTKNEFLSRTIYSAQT